MTKIKTCYDPVTCPILASALLPKLLNVLCFTWRKFHVKVLHNTLKFSNSEWVDNVYLSKITWSVSASPCVVEGVSFNCKSVNVWRGKGHAAVIVGVGGRSGTDGLTLPKQGIINFLPLTCDVLLRKTRLHVWQLVT
jgi:hypothetical protein